MPALIAACPSFKPTWDLHVADWAGDNAHERGVYIDVGVFAHHLVGLLEDGEPQEFPAVFDAVERLLLEGDDGVVSVVKIGLLEDLGNIAASSGGWPFAARFREWFGPATNDAWDELHRFWGTSDSA
jgi:hypothetical protein